MEQNGKIASSHFDRRRTPKKGGAHSINSDAPRHAIMAALP